MRVIISGGGGLIGRALTRSLTGDGHEVVVLSRTPQKVQALPVGARAQWWDGRTAQGWGALADGAQVIVNLAGANLNSWRWTAAAKRAIVNSRRNAGLAVVEAVRAASRPPELLIQQSGIGHYGIHGDEIITEEAPPGSDFMASVTFDWEGVTAPIEQLGVRRIIARSGFVLDNGNIGFSLMVLPFRLFIGGPLGSGQQWFPWVHMADEIGVHRFLIDNQDARGVINLVAPHPLRNRDFARLIGKVLKRPALLTIPTFALRLALGEMATALLDGQRAVPARLQQMGYRFRFPDAESALRDLLAPAG